MAKSRSLPQRHLSGETLLLCHLKPFLSQHNVAAFYQVIRSANTMHANKNGIISSRDNINAILDSQGKRLLLQYIPKMAPSSSLGSQTDTSPCSDRSGPLYSPRVSTQTARFKVLKWGWIDWEKESITAFYEQWMLTLVVRQGKRHIVNGGSHNLWV